MFFAFPLPTTSHLAFSHSLRCDSHPSLTLAATTARTVLRQSLKTFKRLPADSPSRGSCIQAVLSAATDYLPYALALDSGLSGRQVGGEEVVVTLTSELEVEWRTCVATSPPGRQAPRIKGRGLDYEILFVLVTAAYAQSLEANRLAGAFYRPSNQVSTEQRKAGVNSAMDTLLTAHSIFAKAQSISEGLPSGAIPSGALDVQPDILSAMAALSLGSATLLAVVKDDDFLTLAAQARDSTDREWMYKAPNVPKVRAHLFARICIAASDHAAKALAMLNRGLVREDLVRRARNLQATSRARAYRFFGVDAELSGRVGEALGWLNAAKRQLGLPVTSFPGDTKGNKFKPSLTKMKKEWSERKERKEVQGRAGPTLEDAGKVEEGRVIEMLEKNWSKTNDLINHQPVADDDALINALPTGRNPHVPKAWSQPTLETGMLERLRAPPEREEDDGADSGASGDEIEGEQMPGSFSTGSNANPESTYF